ncbi:MAG: hypothetical protein QXX30_04405 [Candidatus Aenigmatarchaeota archaeon]
MDDLEPFYQYLEKLVEIKYQKKIRTQIAGKRLIQFIKRGYYSKTQLLSYLFRYVPYSEFIYFSTWIRYATTVINDIPEIQKALLIGERL